MDWEHYQQVANLIVRLKSDGYKIVVIEQTSQSVPLNKFEFHADEKFCLVFGNEVDGISEEVLPPADYALEIPQLGTKHSLNISVCLGIVCWEFFRKLMLQA